MDGIVAVGIGSETPGTGTSGTDTAGGESGAGGDADGGAPSDGGEEGFGLPPPSGRLTSTAGVTVRSTGVFEALAAAGVTRCVGRPVRDWGVPLSLPILS